MRASLMFAFVCGATAAVALAGEPVSAANAWGGSYCLAYQEGGADCGFTSLAQCQASASGTGDGCYAAPPSLRQEQGAAAVQGVSTQGRRAGRVGRSE